MRSEAEIRRGFERAAKGLDEMRKAGYEEKLIAVQATMCDVLGWVLGAVNTTVGAMIADAEAKDTLRAQRQ